MHKRGPVWHMNRKPSPLGSTSADLAGIDVTKVGGLVGCESVVI